MIADSVKKLKGVKVEKFQKNIHFMSSLRAPSQARGVAIYRQP